MENYFVSRIKLLIFTFKHFNFYKNRIFEIFNRINCITATASKLCLSASINLVIAIPYENYLSVTERIQKRIIQMHSP